jgi:hypothetical protein
MTGITRMEFTPCIIRTGISFGLKMEFKIHYAIEGPR